MDCEGIRERIGHDPAKQDAEIDRHVAECAPCLAYRQRLRSNEQLIQKALRFDIDAARKRAPTNVQGARAPVRRSFLAGIAAGLLGAITLWALVGNRPDLSTEQFAIQVAEHWYDEPGSWADTDVRVSNAVLTTALDGKAEIDLSQLGTVSYARSCLVAGQWVPHLVVQGQQGPFMVLLLPGYEIQDPLPLALPDEGLGGHVVPAGAGSVAVLGGDSDEAERVEAAVVSALDWTI